MFTKVQTSPLTVTPLTVTPRLQWHFWQFSNHSVIKLLAYSDKKCQKLGLSLSTEKEVHNELSPTREIWMFWCTTCHSLSRWLIEWPVDQDQIKIFLLSPFWRHSFCKWIRTKYPWEADHRDSVNLIEVSTGRRLWSSVSNVGMLLFGWHLTIGKIAVLWLNIAWYYFFLIWAI